MLDNETIFDQPAFLPMVTFYAMGQFDIFETLSQAQLEEVVQKASEYSLENPLFDHNKSGQFDQFELPHIGQRSGPYCGVLMAAYLVWQQRKNGFELPTHLSRLIAMCDEAYNLWEAM